MHFVRMLLLCILRTLTSLEAKETTFPYESVSPEGGAVLIVLKSGCLHCLLYPNIRKWHTCIYNIFPSRGIVGCYTTPLPTADLLGSATLSIVGSKYTLEAICR